MSRSLGFFIGLLGNAGVSGYVPSECLGIRIRGSTTNTYNNQCLEKITVELALRAVAFFVRIQLPLYLPKHSQPQFGVIGAQVEATKRAAQLLFCGMCDSGLDVSAGAENAV